MGCSQAKLAALGLLGLAVAGCEIPGSLTPAQASHNFGEVLVGESAESPPVAWRNLGEVTEIVSGQATRPQGGSFAVGAGLSNAVLFVPPGRATNPVSFTFTPQENGPLTGMGLLLIGTRGGEQRESLPLRFTGVGRYRIVGPGIKFLDSNPKDDKALAFGAVDVEAQPIVLPLELLNILPEPLDLRVSLAKGAGFSLVGGVGRLTLPPDEPVTLEVQFAPSELVAYQDVLNFTELDGGERLAAIVLLGEGATSEAPVE